MGGSIHGNAGGYSVGGGVVVVMATVMVMVDEEECRGVGGQRNMDT